MTKMISLRAHHLMCLPGYKGLNYTPESKSNWDVISNMLKENPGTIVQIAKGQDILCLRCPHNSENNSTCREAFVKRLDEAVQSIMGIKVLELYKYEELNKKIHSILNPEMHAKICGDCMWRAYGVCKDTFKKAVEVIQNQIKV